MDKQPQPLFPERRRALMLFDSSTDSLPQHSFTREKPDMWKSITTPPIPINTSFIPLHVLILNPSCLSLLSSTIVTFSTCWVHHHTLPSYLLLVSIDPSERFDSHRESSTVLNSLQSAPLWYWVKESLKTAHLEQRGPFSVFLCHLSVLAFLLTSLCVSISTAFGRFSATN